MRPLHTNRPGRKQVSVCRPTRKSHVLKEAEFLFGKSANANCEVFPKKSSHLSKFILSNGELLIAASNDKHPPVYAIAQNPEPWIAKPS